MTTPTIREIISRAIDSEKQTGLLRAYLVDRQDQLSETLILPEHEPISALLIFITGYIESVPSSLSLVAAVSKKLGFHSYAAPFLVLAEDYFLHPPEPIADAQGLMGLLDEAFLAHRLLEEVNDNHMRHLKRQLLPLDMTEANTIVHHLIGDDLASQLENLVQYAASQLLAEEKAWEQVRNLPASAELPETIVSSEQLMWEPHKVRLRMAS
ncbi:MAG: hypothetical protein AB8B81_02135 [Halioglobus sp.]